MLFAYIYIGKLQIIISLFLWIWFFIKWFALKELLFLHLFWKTHVHIYLGYDMSKLLYFDILCIMHKIIIKLQVIYKFWYHFLIVFILVHDLYEYYLCIRTLIFIRKFTYSYLLFVYFLMYYCIHTALASILSCMLYFDHSLIEWSCFLLNSSLLRLFATAVYSNLKRNHDI